MNEFGVKEIPMMIAIVIVGILFTPTIIRNITGEYYEIQFLPCKSLGRTWKQDGSCGSCRERYHASTIEENSKCFPDDTIVVHMDERNAFVPIGKPVLVKCEFDTNVSCSWKKMDDYFQPDEAYQFSGPDQKTKDCSLLIANFKDTDTGVWACSSRASSDSSAIYGPRVFLSSEEVITVAHNATAYVPPGATVVMKCYFNKKVNCTWERDDEHIAIDQRYSYIAGINGSGQRTPDCSLRIKEVDRFDVAKWECKTLATSSENAVLSTTVELNQLHSPKIIKGPIGLDFVSIGEEVSLRCRFDMEVSCKWNRNGLQVVDNNRYKYKTMDEYSRDCSITIASIRKEDIGQWTCNCEDCINTQHRATSWLVKKQNVIVKGSVNESVALGQAVTLICQDPVNNGNCNWTRRSGFDVYDGDYYDSPGPNCTLRIKHFREIDEGTWECVPNLQLKNPGAINTIRLSTTKTIGPFVNGNSLFGERLILQCWFQQEVSCSWTLETTPINPNKTNGYDYIGNSLQTKDCSISIHKFREKDVGHWLCRSRENSSVVGASIHVIGKTGQLSQPKILLSNNNSRGENINCLLENGMVDTALHWLLDGNQLLEINRKATKNPDTGLYDVTIMLNYTEELFRNATVLTCVTKQDLGELSDQIEVEDLQHFMTEQPEGCLMDHIKNAGLSVGLIIYAVAISFFALVELVCLSPNIKKWIRKDNENLQVPETQNRDEASHPLNPN